MATFWKLKLQFKARHLSCMCTCASAFILILFPIRKFLSSKLWVLYKFTLRTILSSKVCGVFLCGFFFGSHDVILCGWLDSQHQLTNCIKGLGAGWLPRVLSSSAVSCTGTWSCRLRCDGKRSGLQLGPAACLHCRCWVRGCVITLLQVYGGWSAVMIEPTLSVLIN